MIIIIILTIPDQTQRTRITNSHLIYHSSAFCFNGIVSGIHKFAKDIDVRLNGKKVYDCNFVNIKNLLEYSPVYAKSTATNEFFFSIYQCSCRAESSSSKLQCRLLGTNVGASSVVDFELPLENESLPQELK